MSALDVLRQIKQARRALAGGAGAGSAAKVIQWGNSDAINEVGIENLSRRELRNHLEARDLDTQGTRIELIDRLRSSIDDEQLHKLAYTETIDTEFQLQADLEERGSVYVCGLNNKGQLGMGDLENRSTFTAIRQLRGIGVVYLAAGVDLCYALTEDFDVYVWGGNGVGRTGLNPRDASKQNDARPFNFLEPTIVQDLAGEECVKVTVGSSHCMAVGKGGDCFVWGDGDAGQLGLGDFANHHIIAVNNSFPSVQSVSAGSNHSVVLTRETGALYTWGHAANGRLGIGASERIGAASEAERFYFPIPSHISTLEAIKQISCGADHTLARGVSGVWAWGNGSGGRLGTGDNADRFDPVLVPKIRGKIIMTIAAGAWHSMAVVAYPPMTGGGWLYTWGSGYHGQLGQGLKVVSLYAELVDYFTQYHLLVKDIACGSHHCAALTREGELYTWGQNLNGALGRCVFPLLSLVLPSSSAPSSLAPFLTPFLTLSLPAHRKIDERDVSYTATPGHVGGFGAMVNRIGRGYPRHLACGTEFTVVTTSPYEGPDYETARKLMEEAKLRDQEAVVANRG